MPATIIVFIFMNTILLGCAVFVKLKRQIGLPDDDTEPRDGANQGRWFARFADAPAWRSGPET